MPLASPGQRGSGPSVPLDTSTGRMPAARYHGPGDGLVVVEFHHPAAVSTARVRLVDGRAGVSLTPREGGPARHPVDGRIVVEVDGRADHFDIDVPRGTPHFELHVSDRTVFRKTAADIITIWPMGADSIWLIPLTP